MLANVTEEQRSVLTERRLRIGLIARRGEPSQATKRQFIVTD